MPMPVRSLVGRMFGRLFVKERFRDQEARLTFYYCVCKCGTPVPRVQHANLVSGGSESCGCLQREGVATRSRGGPGQAVKTAVWWYYVRNARQRGHEWALDRTLFETLITSACYYCSRVGDMETVSEAGDVFPHNGVDRLDNSVGYTVANSVPCCKPCNQAKNDRSVDEFRDWACALALRLGEW
jgi:hypothetical protein